MENVPNILTIGDGVFSKFIINGLQDIGFNVEVCKINCADFGVPQNRKRVFFIASKQKQSILSLLENKKVDTP